MATLKISQDLWDLIYPIGSTYETTDINFNPNGKFAGTWVEDTDFRPVAYCKTYQTTVISISKNIASVVSGGSNYRVNFTKPMASSNYLPLVTGETSGAAAEIIGVYSIGEYGFYLDVSNASGALVTPSELNIVVFGRFATPDSRIWKRTS